MTTLVTERLLESELILNADGSVYHLNLLPEDVAETIILVGDPNRVAQVSQYFDAIEIKKSKREFVTHTGRIGKKRISVVGTGIGAGNIDIVMNELDALFNIDLQNRVIKEQHQTLQFIRLGTSGSLQQSIAMDSCLISAYGIGLDALVSYYDWKNTADEAALLQQCHAIFAQMPMVGATYVAAGSQALIELFQQNNMGSTGITLTCPGFYAAQGRQLRARRTHHAFLAAAKQIQFQNHVITNLEMETAAIYGLARLLNHDACSISTIVANREACVFSKNPDKAVDMMIQKALMIL